jgi:hypothetical protein
MEVERFKHRQLAPTVGPIVTITGEIEGPLVIKNQSFEADGQDQVHSEIPRRLVKSLRRIFVYAFATISTPVKSGEA